MNDLPDWVKMITGGVAGSIAEVATIPVDTAVFYLKILKKNFRRYDYRSKNRIQMDCINIRVS